MAERVVLMQDGKNISTHCLQYHGCFLSLLLEEMLEDRDMVVGLDMEYVHGSHFHSTGISLLSLCTKRTCVFIPWSNLNHTPLFSNLSLFLNNKDIVFGCVHKRSDLVNLKKAYGLEIRNVVDLSEYAARDRGDRFSFFGVRKLASHLGILQLQTRSKSESLIDWTPHNNGMSLEQVECATVDAYATYKVAKFLLG